MSGRRRRTPLLISMTSPSRDKVISVHTLRVNPELVLLCSGPRFEALRNEPKNSEPLF